MAGVFYQARVQAYTYHLSGHAIMKKELRFPSMSQWEKLLSRWSEFPECGEKRLLCAVVAQAICDKHKSISNSGLQVASVEDISGSFGRWFVNTCRAISLDPVYVLNRFVEAESRVGCVVEIEA